MIEKLGINYHDLKTKNRSLILKLLATGKCNSRIELAKESGLTKMSVSNIISDFISMGLVEESHVEETHGVGRSPIILDINKNGPKVVGLHIGREGCSVALYDLKLNKLNSTYGELSDKTKDGLVALIIGLIDEIIDKNSVIAIGIGTIGPLDLENGVILNPPNFFGITNIHIVDILRERYKIPVYMDSQYNNAALAEKYYGNGKDYDDFIFLGITSGIGSGIILNGELMKNSSMLTSEVGHTSIDFRGNYCDCGNRGCLETYASSNVIRNRLVLETEKENTFEEFCTMTEDPRIDRVFMEMMEYLSYGLVSCINLFNPQIIMLGDRGVFLPDRYLDYLESQINKYKLSKSYNYVKVVRPMFGEQAQLAGSAVCVLEQIFQGNLLINRE
ncbi:MAG: ROK family transcriptional regulator [Lachnospiraceae bacterium]|nr:ROK family transcriptional regulator [Lachnospiraceae bacterium]